MEIRSEPAYTEETVTDVDIAFSDTDVLTFTLREKDIFKEGDVTVVVAQYDPPIVTIVYKSQVRWYRTMVRLIRTPISIPEVTAQSHPSSEPSPTQDEDGPEGPTPHSLSGSSELLTPALEGINAPASPRARRRGRTKKAGSQGSD